MGSSLASLLAPLTDRLWGAWFRKREADRATCQAALDRIRKETPNFEHIITERPCKNAAHEKAVTQTSFELLGVAMSNLSNVRKFRRDAMELRRLADKRDTAGVVAAIERLEPRLEKRTRATF